MRLNALKYLVHLVGDVYQPLHAGYLENKGGNKYQLQAFKKGSNLHALWNSGLIKNMNEDVEAMTARLLKRKAPFSVQKWSAVRAAEQSCEIVGVDGFYPERRVGQEYIDRFMPVLEQQLAAAGTALASVLNQIDARKTRSK
jgi:nuclease S1